MKAPALHPGSVHNRAASIRRQRGAMAIAMMLMLLGLISILGIVEVGYLYWAHRDTQKTADLAALSGVQQLSGPACPPGSPAYVAASGNATDNGGTTANGYSSIDISCGGQPANGSSILAPASASSVAAIKVVANRNVNHIFGMAWKSTFPIKAEAVAINSNPIASFSVGSGLASIDPDSPLNQLLNTTLGTSLGLQLLSYNGIANTNISLLGLIKASPINVGTVSGVLSAPITVSDFLTAYVQALQQSSNAANIDMSIVDTGIASIEAQLGNTIINLGSILNVNANTDDPNVALNTDVSALDILNAVVLAADSKNAVALPAGSINLPGVATANLSLSIIEPPQIGIGGIGTTAHTAQIRLAAHLSALSAINLGGQPLSDLSVALEVAPTDGTISNITCNAANGSTTTNNVTINVTPGVANAAIANYTYLTNAFQNTSQTWSSILSAAESSEANGWDHVVDVSVAGVSLVSIDLFTNAQLAATPPFSHTFEVDPSTPVADQSGMTYPSALDADPSTESGLLISSLLGSNVKVGINVIGLNLNLSVGSILNALGPLLNTLLAPVLDNLVDPLLQVVGVELGTGQVNLLSVNCNSGAQLVY